MTGSGAVGWLMTGSGSSRMVDDRLRKQSYGCWPAQEAVGWLMTGSGSSRMVDDRLRK